MSGWTGKEKPEEQTGVERDPTAFDIVHHRNPKTGKVFKATHYAYITSKTGASYYFRDGKRYNADGSLMDVPAAPKAAAKSEAGNAPEETPKPEPQPEAPKPEPEKPAAVATEPKDELKPKPKKVKAEKPKEEEEGNPFKNASAR